MAKAGYVYILTNPSFRKDWVKIGKTARPVNTRSKELDNTAVPLPFEIYATLKTAEFAKAEKLIHEMIDGLTDKRIRKTREFFNIKPEQALKVLRAVGNVLGGEIVIEGPTRAEKLAHKVSRKDAELRCAGAGGDAKGRNTANGFVVQKGSKVSKTIAPSFKKKSGYYKLRCSLEAGGTIKSRIFTRDCIFDSLSAASSVVLGRCSNGKKEWKSKVCAEGV